MKRPATFINGRRIFQFLSTHYFEMIKKLLLGALTFGLWWYNAFGIGAWVDNPGNSTSSFEVTHDASFTEPVLSTTTTTSTSMIPKKTEAAKPSLPSAIELSGNTTENYWKDYQLLGLYNIHGTRNGAPSYKRARNAFILGRYLRTGGS